MGGSGLSATLRDYGRFAQFVLDDGVIDGRRVVGEHWFEESTRAQPDQAPYGYQWWLPQSAHPRHIGAFIGMGIFGQRLYLHPKQELAIVVLSARSKPSDSHVIPDEDFFGGSADDLRAARAASGRPVLRKDFTVGPRDVCDARLMGADCVLLIAAALSRAELVDLHRLAVEVGLDVLVEIHDEPELDVALEAGATLDDISELRDILRSVLIDRAKHQMQLSAARFVQGAA